MRIALLFFQVIILISSCGVLKNNSWQLQRTGQLEAVLKPTAMSLPNQVAEPSLDTYAGEMVEEITDQRIGSDIGADMLKIRNSRDTVIQKLVHTGENISSRVVRSETSLSTSKGKEQSKETMWRITARYKILAIGYAILTLISIPFVFLAVEWLSPAFVLVPFLGLFATMLAVVLGKRSKQWSNYLTEKDLHPSSSEATSNEQTPKGSPNRLRTWSIIGSIPILFFSVVLVTGLISLLLLLG